MTAAQLADAIHELLDQALEAATDPDDGMFEFAESLAGISEIATYKDAGVLTSDKGLVVRTADGREFQVTVVRSR